LFHLQIWFIGRTL